MTLLVVCVVAGVALAVVSVTMLLVGLLALCPPRQSARHLGCGHPRVMNSNDDGDRCLWCRHERLVHALLIPNQLTHLGG